MTNPNDGKAMTPKEAVANTDKELWRRVSDDYYSPSIHVTQGGGIGINVGGRVIVASVEKWHLALATLEALAEENAKLKTALKELAENIHPEAAYISRVEEYTKLECQFYALQDENASLKAELDGYKIRVALDAETIKLNFETIDKAKAEVREWICESCNTVYPGPPQDGFSCVVCPKCGGRTDTRAGAEIRKLKAEAPHAKEIAEGVGYRLQQAELALARYRRFDPLIEAAESDGEFSVVGETSPVADKVIRAVVNLRAALKCREKAIPERDK